MKPIVLDDVGGATLSECGTYRYELWRLIEGDGRGEVAFIMLNPSTADASVDDPTIRRCKDFAKRWGYARLRVVNLYAFRATDPKELRRQCVHQAFGPANDGAIRAALLASDRVVAAWGASLPPSFVAIRWAIEELVKEAKKPLWCLGTTDKGHPRHPLYVPGDKELEPYTL